MKSSADIVGEVRLMAETVSSELGLEIYDVEFKKERGSYALTIYIDKDHGITSDDCENMSNAIEPLLDEANIISQSYRLCVSSPGITRELRNERDFFRFMGRLVDVKLRNKNEILGTAVFKGVLTEYRNGTIAVNSDKNFLIEFEKSDAVYVKLAIDF